MLLHQIPCAERMECGDLAARKQLADFYWEPSKLGSSESIYLILSKNIILSDLSGSLFHYFLCLEPQADVFAKPAKASAC